jgi:hypothetical protein
LKSVHRRRGQSNQSLAAETAPPISHRFTIPLSGPQTLRDGVAASWIVGVVSAILAFQSISVTGEDRRL